MRGDLPPLGLEDFDEFVRVVHDFTPMRWQRRLLEEHGADGDWPDVVKVPTGLGKTLLVDVAVFALALQGHREPRERTARTRVFVIVDRRLVVDDIHGHSLSLAEALEGAPPDGVAGRVAARLRAIAARPVSVEEPDVVSARQRPLEVTRMRGGVTWASRWVMWPEQPTVVVGTVDQLGSRMLFRGYGVSPGSLPIDAALTGADALVILDEAHLADALRRTVSELQAFEGAVSEPVLPQRPPRLVAMSATPLPSENAFELDDLDRAEEEAARRLKARKPAALWELTDAPKQEAAAARARLAEVLASAAQRLLQEEPEVQVLGVVANTVQTARATFELLHGDGVDADLLVGRSREIDRELLAKRIRERAGIHRREGALQAPYVVVATQTIEVGVNLDLDALVTEAAALDALAQRLGRVDRRGDRTARGLDSPVVIAHVEGLHDDDPVYGQPLRKSWDWLCSLGAPEVVRGKRGSDKAALDGEVDLGPAALDRLLDDDLRSRLVTNPPLRPTLFPREHLHGWSHTSPRPRSDVDPTPFMRGIAEPQPTVNVCWRADVRRDRLDESATESLDLRPMLAGEVVEVPLWHARRWLARLEGDAAPMADSPLVQATDDPGDVDAVRLPAVRLGEDGEPQALRRSARLRPGDTLVCPSTVGGLDAFGWAPEQGGEVLDVADLCRTRNGVAVRVHPASIGQFGKGPADRLRSWMRALRVGLDESPPSRLDHGVTAFTAAWLTDEGLEQAPARGARAVAQALEACLATEPFRLQTEDHRAALCDLLGEITSDDWSSWLEVTDDAGSAGHGLQILLRARAAASGPRVTSEQQRDADDSASLSGRPDAGVRQSQVTLWAHGAAVGASARASAERLGLPSRLVDAVGLAAEAHDLGKVDPRFQRMLHGGDSFAAAAAREPLAKSGMNPADRRAFRRAREDAGWPAEMRHEALSLALVAAWFDAEADASDVESELVRHLVATHHGQGRPLSFPARDAKAMDLAADFHGHRLAVSGPEAEPYLVDWEAPGRIAGLLDRHGAWGLALLEAIVRLADMRCSEAGT